MGVAALKENLRYIKRGRPGHRFRDYNAHERRKHHGGRSLARILTLLLGLTSVIVGLVLCVIPGPGLPFIFIGGGLLAAESLSVAKIMDWLEVRVRAVWKWAMRYWTRWPRSARVIAGILIVAGGLASSFLFYRLVSG